MGFRLRKNCHLQPGSWIKTGSYHSMSPFPLRCRNTDVCGGQTESSCRQSLTADAEMGWRKELLSNVMLHTADLAESVHKIRRVALMLFQKMKPLLQQPIIIFQIRKKKILAAETSCYKKSPPRFHKLKDLTRNGTYTSRFTWSRKLFGSRWQDDDPMLCFLFFFPPIAFSFVISPSAETQVLVHQGEQSHVIGCFPIWAPDSTMLITNWWEIH